MSEQTPLSIEVVESAGPLRLASSWLTEAQVRTATPNPNAMALATVDDDGRPACRIVLCKHFDDNAGHLTFYTNYQSRKGRELSRNASYTAVFHWDAAERQLRIDGEAERLSAAASDAYFASRPWRSRIGAWASQQSAAIESRAALDAQARDAATRFGLPDPFGNDEPKTAAEIARPPRWGGYRLWIRRIEFWQGGIGRIHDRIQCERELRHSGASGWETGDFTARRLQP